MSAAEHTGKLILDIPHTGRSTVVAAAGAGRQSSGPTAPTSSPAGWVASGCSWPRRWPRGGAGRIVLSSRSAPDQRALETIELVRATGSDVVVECGDIAARRHRAAAGGDGNRHRAAAARRAARRRGGRGRHPDQHHRRR